MQMENSSNVYTMQYAAFWSYLGAYVTTVVSYYLLFYAEEFFFIYN